jgi:hypothetical protein
VIPQYRRSKSDAAWRASNWMLRQWTTTEHYASRGNQEADKRIALVHCSVLERPLFLYLENGMSEQIQHPGVRRGAQGDEQHLVRHLAILAVLLATIGSFYFATIRDGHAWGDDFALYIQHAKNIVQHVPYSQTNYIFNPHIPDAGPRTFPPGYPLLLSIVYWHFGMNFTAMKAENIVLFILFLVVLFLLLRPELPGSYVNATIAIIGFNPYLWNFKDAVVSDIAFVLFAYIALFLIQRTYRSYSGKVPWMTVVGTAAMIYAAYATRSVGLVFIPMLFLYELLRYKRVPRIAISVTVLFLVGWFLQAKLLHNDSDYLLQVNLAPKSIIHRSLDCFIAIQRWFFWKPTLNQGIRTVIFVGLWGLAIFGYVTRVRREITSYELFPFLYSGVVTLFPALGAEPRYMLPVVPLFFLFVFSGVEALPKISSLDTRKYAFIVLLVGTAGIYASIYSTMKLDSIRDAIDKNGYELFDYVRTNTEPTAVFVFRKPRALGLFGERRTSMYHPYHDENDLWKYFTTIHADYLVEGPIDEPYWHTFIASQKDKLLEVHSNPEFTVYKITATELKK